MKKKQIEQENNSLEAALKRTDPTDHIFKFVGAKGDDSIPSFSCIFCGLLVNQSMVLEVYGRTEGFGAFNEELLKKMGLPCKGRYN